MVLLVKGKRRQTIGAKTSSDLRRLVRRYQERQDGHSIDPAGRGRLHGQADQQPCCGVGVGIVDVELHRPDLVVSGIIGGIVDVVIDGFRERCRCTILIISFDHDFFCRTILDRANQVDLI